MPVQRVQLREFAQVRSGDKGDSVDIGLFSPTEELYEVMKAQVTVDRVAEYFKAIARGPVQRHELPGLKALKFVIHSALGGGGPASLRTDNLGKAYGANLLRLEVEIDPSLLDNVPSLRHPGGWPPAK